jgi:glycosyltransferase involved in cell wall biosynthesis
MAKVLFLLGAYYPEPSANGVCCNELIKFFLLQKHEVLLICNKQKGMTKPTIIGEVKVFPVSDLLYQQYAEKKRFAKNAILKFVYSLLEKLTDYARLLCFSPFYPICSPIRKKNFLKCAKEVINKEKIDIVIPVCMPADAVFASIQLKKLFPRITLITYLLDPIAGGLNHKLYSKKRAYELALNNERRVVEISDAVVAQLEHKSHFEKEYSGIELKNLYFLGVPLLTEKLVKNNRASKKKIVVYAGAISEKNRNPQYIINVFKQTNCSRLVMYITNDPSIAIEIAGNSPNIEIRGRISHDELEEVLADADAFLNIGNNQQMQSPSKLVEYISYGKPIISTYRIDEDTSAKLLDGFSNALLLDERASNDFNAIAMSIDNFLTDHNSVIPFDELKQKFKPFSPESFYDIVMNKFCNSSLKMLKGLAEWKD